jgi:hypothetical protein
MDVCLQENKPMFIMLKNNRPVSNMLLKFTKLVFWFSKTEKDMLRDNSDLEKDTQPKILERWSRCGQKNN